MSRSISLSLLRFFFDAESGSCLPFDYGGCEGNGNNFKTEDMCRAECAEKSPADGCVELYHLDGMLEVTLTNVDLGQKAALGSRTTQTVFHCR